jgi:type III secretory pathway component EscU
MVKGRKRTKELTMLNKTLKDTKDNIQEEFKDTKGVIRIRKSKKDRQHNGQKKKYKKTKNDLQNIHIKLKIE